MTDTTQILRDVLHCISQESSPRLERYLNIDKETYIKDCVDSVHTRRISQQANGRWRTYVGTEQVWGKTESELYDKLYLRYFKKKTFGEIFEEMMNYWETEKHRNPKTIRAYRYDYQRFFKGSEIEDLDLRSITISVLKKFLASCHAEPIKKQRHSSIRTIINKVFAYSAEYLEDPVMNLMTSIDYNGVEYKDKVSPLSNKGYYDADARATILEYIDSLETPTLAELAVAAFFELGTRNSETRALRFDSFHIKEGYVRIDGKDDGHGRRENRVKSDSAAGMGNIAITPRLERIYAKARALSWSSEYLFVCDKAYAKNGRVLMSECATRRALRRICEKLGIEYINGGGVHAIRFSNATQMAADGVSISDIQHYLRHTTPAMSLHYVQDYQKSIPVHGVDNDRIIAERKAALLNEDLVKKRDPKKCEIIAFPGQNDRGASRI